MFRPGTDGAEPSGDQADSSALAEHRAVKAVGAHLREALDNPARVPHDLVVVGKLPEGGEDGGRRAGGGRRRHSLFCEGGRFAPAINAADGSEGPEPQLLYLF